MLYLYFLFKVRRARVIKNKNRGGFIDRQRNGVGVLALADLFEKNEKKNKTTSEYRQTSIEWFAFLFLTV